MNKIKALVVSLTLATSLTSIGEDITVYDGVSLSPTGWYGKQENQEVEPGNVANQLWDMESFDLTDSRLTMTGGYNFTSPLGYDGFKPGDIFFDVNGGGYNFVATISSTGPKYDVYELPANTHSVFFAHNVASNPWKYKSGGILTESQLPVNYGSFVDGEGTHYTAMLDVFWLLETLSNGDIVTIHNTMECGNDNLMGRFTFHQNVIPEGNVMIPAVGLFGIALWAIKRKSAKLV